MTGFPAAGDRIKLYMLSGFGKRERAYGYVEMTQFDKHLRAARTRKRESKTLDFKARLDVNSTRDWVELVKDLVAMANSGGGVIVVGVNDNGTVSGSGVSALIAYDSAKVTDKIARYTGQQYSDFEIHEVARDDAKVAAIVLHGVDVPMAFVREGGYDDDAGKSKIAFRLGTVYFRHGAKSEPCSSADLTAAIDRNVQRQRREWLGNIAKVVKAPIGHKVSVHPPDVRVTTSTDTAAIRVTQDPEAPAMRIQSRDEAYPYRLKELTAELKRRLEGQLRVTTAVLQAARKAHNIDDKPEFISMSKFTSPQYSLVYLEWLLSEYDSDNGFFEKAVKTGRQYSK